MQSTRADMVMAVWVVGVLNRESAGLTPKQSPADYHEGAGGFWPLHRLPLQLLGALQADRRAKDSNRRSDVSARRGQRPCSVALRLCVALPWYKTTRMYMQQNACITVLRVVRREVSVSSVATGVSVGQPCASMEHHQHTLSVIWGHLSSARILWSEAAAHTNDLTV